jgi:hypothetical protein
MSISLKAEHIYSYQSEAAGIRTLIASAADSTGTYSLSNGAIYWDVNGIPQIIFTPAAGAADLRGVFSGDYEYFCDGVQGDLLKWTYPGPVSQWGTAAPTTAVTVAAPSTGLITLLTGRTYYTAFYNPTTGNFSDLSPLSITTGALTLQEIPLTAIPYSADPTYSQTYIFATADGNDPTVLYLLASLTAGILTYTDNTPELNLLEADVYQFIDANGVSHGILGNQPPPNGSFPIKYGGRIWMALNENLQYSKSMADLITATGNIPGRYEEDWPPTNVIDISEDAEEIHGLLTDGYGLYIGTESCIRRLTGSDPTTFSETNPIFNDVGLLWQDVWQIVFLEGTPVGSMWMSPDLRVIGSDFNTYTNVGLEIQNTLNTLNPLAYKNAWAIAPQLGIYSFYVLAIPTGSNMIPDTFCVYDMRLKKWYIWNMMDTFSSAIFYVSLGGTPRWLVCDSTGQMRNFDPSFVMDRSGDGTQTGITSTAQSTWLDMGDPTTRKLLNEVEIQTSDPNLLVSVQGASQTVTFTTPVNTLVTNSALITSAFGDYKVYLAGTPTKDRYYRYKIVSTSTVGSLETDIVLGEVGFEVFPLHRF